MQLEHTTIYRAGKTARSLNFETKACWFGVNGPNAPINLRFDLASAGGGTTQVLIEIGKDDLRSILTAVATEMPESADVMSNAGALAAEKLRDELAEARRIDAESKTLATALNDKLEIVREYVDEKYCEAPLQGDARERAVKDHLDEVVQSLRSSSL
jgi:hypothetical protein